MVWWWWCACDGVLVCVVCMCVVMACLCMCVCVMVWWWWCACGVVCMCVVMVCLCMYVCVMVWCVCGVCDCALACCVMCDGVFMCVWWCDSLHWIGTPGVGDLSPSSSAGFLGSAPSSPNVSVTTVCSVSDSYGARRNMREKRMEEADNWHQAASQSKFGFTQHLVATVTHM